MMKTTINNLTIYEVMALDWDVSLSVNKKSGFDLLLHSNDVYAVEEGISESAIESLAYFCKQYLHDYNRIASTLL